MVAFLSLNQSLGSNTVPNNIFFFLGRVAPLTTCLEDSDPRGRRQRRFTGAGTGKLPHWPHAGSANGCSSSFKKPERKHDQFL